MATMGATRLQFLSKYPNIRRGTKLDVPDEVSQALEELVLEKILKESPLATVIKVFDLVTASIVVGEKGRRGQVQMIARLRLEADDGQCATISPGNRYELEPNHARHLCAAWLHMGDIFCSWWDGSVLVTHLLVLGAGIPLPSLSTVATTLSIEGLGSALTDLKSTLPQKLQLARDVAVEAVLAGRDMPDLGKPWLKEYQVRIIGKEEPIWISEDTANKLCGSVGAW